MKTPGVLSNTEFRGFWLRFTENNAGELLIEVGKNGEDTPFMTGVDRDPLKIKFFGLNAWGTNYYKLWASRG